MDVVRSLLLAGSQNTWLSRQAMRQPFVRRAVSRFMPGESMEDALLAARRLGERRMGAILTHLGENIRAASEAEEEAEHYLRLLERISSEKVDAEPSVKLTQLGLDIDPALAEAHAGRIAECARAARKRLWIDMESSSYTSATLETYMRLRAGGADLGVAIQAYLERTPQDVERLIPVGAAFRLVKGAYREPGAIALQSRREIDERFFALAVRLLDDDARRAGVRLTVATHDPALLRRVEALVQERKIDHDAFEFAMLYGIQTGEQERLVSAGYRVRVLVSYGAHWFPWYMRRLAEKPSNMLLVARSLVKRHGQARARSSSPSTR